MICPGGGLTTEIDLIRVNFETFTEASKTVPESYKCKPGVAGTHSDPRMRAQPEDRVGDQEENAAGRRRK